MVSVFHSTGSFAQNPRPSKQIAGVNSYSHQIASIGGYQSASISFSVNLVNAEDWIYSGAGRHIRVFSHLGNIVWEGIVDSVSFSVGARSLTVGSFSDVVNRVKVAYSLRNPPAGTPDADRYLETDWAENADSVRIYGVLEELVSGGSGYSTEMEVLRDQRLLDSLTPSISESISTTQGSPEVVMSLSCVGYTKLFEKQTYIYGSSIEYDDLSVKVSSIIDANLNTPIFILNQDIRNVGLQALLHETQRRTAWGIIKDDISKGADSGSNIVCGMFANNTFILDLINDRNVYSRNGGESIIRDLSGNPIPPSEVLPGRVMRNNDLSIPISYKIDSVGYTLSSNSVQINEQARSLKTILSRTMLGGLY
ncbi:MAG: hypothetical protein DRI46_09410 [Chloroflexi bacterium]|nr:MAG: hypothetical protein DRI46_09410 [Chloroflexota bacterium]